MLLPFLAGVWTLTRLSNEHHSPHSTWFCGQIAFTFFFLALFQKKQSDKQNLLKLPRADETSPYLGCHTFWTLKIRRYQADKCYIAARKLKKKNYYSSSWKKKSVRRKNLFGRKTDQQDGPSGGNYPLGNRHQVATGLSQLQQKKPRKRLLVKPNTRNARRARTGRPC